MLIGLIKNCMLNKNYIIVDKKNYRVISYCNNRKCSITTNKNLFMDNLLLSVEKIIEKTGKCPKIKIIGG